MENTYGERKDTYPFSKTSNNCARYNYEAYKFGEKEYTKDPNNRSEHPDHWPHDLREAIEFHNNQKDQKDRATKERLLRLVK